MGAMPRRRCPCCDSSEPPISGSRPSLLGVLIAVGLGASCIGLPFFWLGLLVREPTLTCPDCGYRYDFARRGQRDDFYY